MIISTESTNTSSMQGLVSHSNENDDRKGRGKLDSCLEVSFIYLYRYF